MATIERMFPIEPLNDLARLESYNKHYYRPANYIHKWWARRLGSVFRTILLSAFSEATTTGPPVRIMGENRLWRGQETGQSAIFIEGGDDMWSRYYKGADFGGKIVLDPFMGGGTTITEALRLGCKVVGSDLNPVAWWTVKEAVTPISLKRLDAAFEEVRSEVEDEIQSLYRTTCPGCSDEVPAVYFIWGKQAPCVSCGHLTPLRPDYVLRYENRREATVFCPDCGNVFGPVTVRRGREPAETCCPRCETRFIPTDSPVSNSTFACEGCGRRQSVLASAQEAERILPEPMTAIRYACPQCGEGFREPAQTCGDR